MSDAKQAAEARRAKILARSQARLKSVGGGVADDVANEVLPAEAGIAAEASTSGLEPSAAPPTCQQSSAPQVHAPHLPAQLPQDTNVRHHTASRPPTLPPGPPLIQPILGQTAVPATSQPAVQATHQETACAGGPRPATPAAVPSPSATEPGQAPVATAEPRQRRGPSESQLGKEAPSSSKASAQPEGNVGGGGLGPGSSAALPSPINPSIGLLNTSVKFSRLMRYLVALYYAHALVRASGPPSMPPLLVLSAVQGRLALEDAEVEIPARLRGFDTWGFLLRLAPELRAIMSSLTSVAACLKGVTDGAAVFIVSYVLLQHVSPPPETEAHNSEL